MWCQTFVWCSCCFGVFLEAGKTWRKEYNKGEKRKGPREAIPMATAVVSGELLLVGGIMTPLCGFRPIFVFGIFVVKHYYSLHGLCVFHLYSSISRLLF